MSSNKDVALKKSASARFWITAPIKKRHVKKWCHPANSKKPALTSRVGNTKTTRWRKLFFFSIKKHETRNATVALPWQRRRTKATSTPRRAVALRNKQKSREPQQKHTNQPAVAWIHKNLPAIEKRPPLRNRVPYKRAPRLVHFTHFIQI